MCLVGRENSYYILPILQGKYSCRTENTSYWANQITFFPLSLLMVCYYWLRVSTYGLLLLLLTSHNHPNPTDPGAAKCLQLAHGREWEWVFLTYFTISVARGWDMLLEDLDFLSLLSCFLQWLSVYAKCMHKLQYPVQPKLVSFQIYWEAMGILSSLILVRILLTL